MADQSAQDDVLARVAATIASRTAGTSAAAINVTPRTFMLVRMANVSNSINSASMREILTPETSATSGSNVVNSSGR